VCKVCTLAVIEKEIKKSKVAVQVNNAQHTMTNILSKNEKAKKAYQRILVYK